VSPDPGRSSEDGRLADLFEMYRVAIEDLESLQDPAVAPLLRELATLQRFVGAQQAQPKT
jgi:hypothetical protein